MSRHQSTYYRYLAIPPNYGPTDGLRWSKNGEAIETHEGRTFVFRASLPPFLEGMAIQRPLMQFVYVLDLLHLLGHRDEPWDGVPRRACTTLRESFRRAGAPLRNAGAFLGFLCKDLQLASDLNKDGDLPKWLASVPALLMVGSESHEKPPLDAVEFHRIVGVLLQDISEEELQHWFRFGRPSLQDEGKRLAKAIADVKPPATRGATLEELLRQRPRLAGALPLVEKLIAALTLPPRRQPPQLPLGGYADVTTRGEPERLLPSQFALDADEFVRRFAEKELMYFRKEEPNRRTHEQIVLLLDQGVRTWGVVRLALSAALLAFRDLAIRQKRPFFVRFSCASAERTDPTACDLPTLVDRLEASDLTANPACLLEAEAGEDELENAEVVLLTHPRSLLDDAVKNSSLLLSGNRRLFVLGVDDEGIGQFSQMRGGETAPIGRFRLNFQESEPVPVPVLQSPRSWTGDIESVPFPFSIGPFQTIVALAFDADSEHLLIVTQKGYLHLYELESGRCEMLPRGCVNGQILATVDEVMGFHGGFVIGGRICDELVAIHYNSRERTVKLYPMGPATSSTPRWYGFADLNSVVIHLGVFRCLDLATGAIIVKPVPWSNRSANTQAACLRLRESETQPPWIPTRVEEPHLNPPRSPFVIVYRDLGVVNLFNGGPAKTCRVIADGKPVQFSTGPFVAQLAQNMLAFLNTNPNAPIWYIFDVTGKPTLLGEYNLGMREMRWFRLSPDGKSFAMPSKHNEITVRAVGDGASNRLVTARGRLHSNLSVYLGAARLEIVIGRKRHSISWPEGSLEHRFRRTEKGELVDVELVAARRGLNHPLMRADPFRFNSIASVEVEVLVDTTGQVVVRDFHRDQLVCIFFVRRNQFAAWMPDGTCYGPTDLIGGPATPDALNRLGAALRQASLPKV